MNFTAVVLLAVLTGCAVDASISETFSSGGSTGKIVVYPRSEVDASRWEAEVQAGIDMWNNILPAGCEFPVRTGEGTFRVTLVPYEKWVWDPRYGGLQYPNEVVIRGDFSQDRSGMVAHELGHLVFGPEHRDVVGSLMYTEVHGWSRPATDDGAWAAEKLCD